jgi:glycosyltransferase involved in cell wall biosynthesis
MPPRFSILLPTHNRADVIGYAIRSVLWQTEQDFELLIVGDGCTDRTAEVVASFSDPRIRWFDLPKAPLSGFANRNLALRQARGRYIAYAQHDDIMFPDHLAKLAAAAEAAGARWCYSRPLWVTRDGVVVPYAVNLTNADELAYFFRGQNTIPSCCVLHTRECLERVGYWPEDVAMADWIYWHRIIESDPCHVLAYCLEPTVLHFRAAWKTGDAKPVAQLAAIARGAPWWPRILIADVPQGVTEQAIVFDAIQSGGMSYVAEFRTAIDRLIERLAWNQIFRSDSAMVDFTPSRGRE